jgi:predicted transcriptional regulator
MKKQILTKKEFEIMTTVWQMHASFTYHDILSRNENINRNTLMAVLSKLLKMDFLTVSGFTYHDNCLTRTYGSCCSQGEYFEQFMDEENRNQMLALLISQADSAKLKEILSLVENRQKELAIQAIQENAK